MSDAAKNPAIPDEEKQPQQDIPMSQTIGAQLAAQREARSWTIEQVATQLNLAPRQIQALEADNFGALPGMASVRGFIRAYAKLLRIDATPLIALLAREQVEPSEPAPTRRPLAATFSSESRLPSMGRSGTPSKSTIVSLFVIVLLTGGIAAYQMGWITIPDTVFTAKNAESTSISASAQTQSTQNQVLGTTSNPLKSDAVASMPPSNSAVIASNAASPMTNESVVATAAPLAPPASSTVPASGKETTVDKDALVLIVREDSWVEIRRVGGNQVNNIIFSRLLKAGSTETIEITEPVAVTVGNAAGVEATLRGAPLDLKTGIKSNVAKLNLK